MLRVTNTASWQKEEFKPIKDKTVLFYHCGPTVYWNQHIGNMRAVVLTDLIRRSLIKLGYDVKLVRNYTDFGHLTSDADVGEDKMERAAKREALSPTEIANKYIATYEKDVANLNAMPPTIQTRATDYLPQMIDMIKELVEKGYAYITNKAIYYEIAKFPKYYELSRHISEHNIEGAGHGDVSDSDKKNPADFALWFFKTGDHKNALQYWPSPFSSPEVDNGNGAPGWHIECSAMARATLGDQIDIHMGGVEHISIHHTNEIAQTEAITGKKFVNYWLHNEHLMLNGKKIAKSDGNMYLLDDLIEKGFDPLDLRYFFLQSHYRSKQNFTWEALTASQTARLKIINAYKKLTELSDSSGKVIDTLDKKFNTALEDDFNIPVALAVVWEVIKSDEKPEDIVATLDEFDKVLGLNIKQLALENVSELKTNPEIESLIKERVTARKNKDWTKADEIRDLLKSKYDYVVKDGKNN